MSLPVTTRSTRPGWARRKPASKFLPADARVIPVHGVAISRDDLRWSIDCLVAVQDQVQAAVAQVRLPKFRGYALFDWVHAGLNVPAAYRDLKGK